MHRLGALACLVRSGIGSADLSRGQKSPPSPSVLFVQTENNKLFWLTVFHFPFIWFPRSCSVCLTGCDLLRFPPRCFSPGIYTKRIPWRVSFSSPVMPRPLKPAQGTKPLMVTWNEGHKNVNRAGGQNVFKMSVLMSWLLHVWLYSRWHAGYNEVFSNKCETPQIHGQLQPEKNKTTKASTTKTLNRFPWNLGNSSVNYESNLKTN